MFDGSLPGPDTLREVDDAVLVGAIAGWAQVAAATEARGLAAVAELVRRRCDDEDDRNTWVCDPWDAAAAEVSAALNIGHGRAIGQLDLSVMLRDRLPKTNALFLTGQITGRLVSTLAWRTLLVSDDALACTCGSPACPAGVDDGRASSVVVHIVADTAALQAQPDPGMHGEEPLPAEPAEPAKLSRPKAGIIPGGPIVPAPLLAELIRTGAHVRHLSAPAAAAEPRYRPSTALDEFVRIRDLTCRFPGCDRPAEYCDLDHTIPWPHGSTHPANLKPYCRKHHLLKTFWTGDGWTDRQLPDGTVVFTAPSGLTYTTRPGSTLLYPDWNTTTTPVPKPAVLGTRGPGATLMMPKRKRTRTQNRAHRIKAERALNDEYVAERNKPSRF